MYLNGGLVTSGTRNGEAITPDEGNSWNTAQSIQSLGAIFQVLPLPICGPIPGIAVDAGPTTFNPIL
jgi:hypothetical protein